MKRYAKKFTVIYFLKNSVKAAQNKWLVLRPKGFEKEVRAGGFFFISDFFLFIFYIKFQEIRIDRDMPFVWYITGQQRILEWTLKSENTNFITIPSLNETVFAD